VCKSFNKQDDCFELTIFRRFRDGWLKNQTDGKSIVDRYYNIAPHIVENIDKFPNSKEIYYSIWKNWLHPCLRLISEQKYEECKLKYIDMVKNLEKSYE
jgi:hypothetical protein